MLLGELEKQVLNYLWSVQSADAKQVHGVIAKLRGGTLNTIQSTLERLFKKSLLSRSKQGHAYIYSPQVGRDELIAQLINDVTHDFVDAGENGFVAAFSSVSSKLSEQQLNELERLIEVQKKHNQQEPSE